MGSESWLLRHSCLNKTCPADAHDAGPPVPPMLLIMAGVRSIFKVDGASVLLALLEIALPWTFTLLADCSQLFLIHQATQDPPRQDPSQLSVSVRQVDVYCTVLGRWKHFLHMLRFAGPVSRWQSFVLGLRCRAFSGICSPNHRKAPPNKSSTKQMETNKICVCKKAGGAPGGVSSCCRGGGEEGGPWAKGMKYCMHSRDSRFERHSCCTWRTMLRPCPTSPILPCSRFTGTRGARLNIFTKHTAANQHYATRLSTLATVDGRAILHFPARSTAQQDARVHRCIWTC